MEQQKPDFEIPPAGKRLPKEDLEQLLPWSESDQEPTFITVRSEYIVAAAVKRRPRRSPAPRSTQSRPK